MGLRSLRKLPVVAAAALIAGTAVVPRPASSQQSPNLRDLEVARDLVVQAPGRPRVILEDLQDQQVAKRRQEATAA